MNNDVSGKTPGGITKTPIVICPPAGAARLTAEGRSLALLIRHGQTDWNLERRLQGRESVPLNDVGRGQSTECGKLIAKAIAAGLDIKMMFSSPLGRAADTARFMADELPFDRIETCDELIERDYGVLSGLNTE